MKFKMFFLFVMLAIITVPFVVMATPDVPPIYNEILNAETLAAVLGVIGAVEILLNMINIKGFLAVIVTIFASLIFAITQYGLGAGQITFGLIVGVLAALSFYVSKNIGDVAGAGAGVGNAAGKQKFIGRVFSFLRSNQGVVSTIGKVLKYLIVRK